MKKLLFSLAIAIMSLSTAAAQLTNKKSNEFSVNLGYNFGLSENGGGTIFLQPEYGKHFTDQFYLGIGTGLRTDDGFDTWLIPAFLRAEVDFQAGNFTPYISLQGGYDFNISGFNGTGIGRISPTIGVKVPVSQHTTFNLGFGYTREIYDGGGADYLGFNAGISFNSGGRGFANFMKRFEYSLELETMLPVSGPIYKDNHQQCQNKISSIVGVRFSGLLPTGLENLYAGYSLGIGMCNDEFTNESRGFSATSEDKTGYINIMARAKYKIKQLSITNKIYPYAQVDMGMAGYEACLFSINPSVGISIMTSKEKSIDISAGYYSVGFEDIGGEYETVSKGTIRIAAGYTF